MVAYKRLREVFTYGQEKGHPAAVSKETSAGRCPA